MVKKPALCLVCGYSNSGKTTLVEKLVAAFSARGYLVATAKSHRGEVQTDAPGKDTWRHRKAGAIATFFVTGSEVVTFASKPAALEFSPKDLIKNCPKGTHLLLAEGFKEAEGLPRVEVLGEGQAPELREGTICVAAASPASVSAPVPVFSRDDAQKICETIIERAMGGG